MSKLRKKLEYLNPNIKKDISDKNNETADPTKLTNREKLERLVNSKLKNKTLNTPPQKLQPKRTNPTEAFSIYNFFYDNKESFGPVKVEDWHNTETPNLSILGNNPILGNIKPEKFLFFDTETTGLSGGTGTLPFMHGFGWLEKNGFSVSIYMLNDPSEEPQFLETIENFLKEKEFEALVTYNGKSFDIPLTETRLLLHRKKSSLLSLEHLDLLYPARTIWKNTYNSRKLGYLGDLLLGISREEDVDGSLIPSLYNSYIRTGNFSLIEKVIEHNALDLVGLNLLMLLSLQYLNSHGENTTHHGERLGTAILFDQGTEHQKAEKIYKSLIDLFPEDDITRLAVKKLAELKKRYKLYDEAEELWASLAEKIDKGSARELAIHYEHRQKDPFKALQLIESIIDEIQMTTIQQENMLKRVKRLKRKIEKLSNHQ